MKQQNIKHCDVPFIQIHLILFTFLMDPRRQSLTTTDTTVQCSSRKMCNTVGGDSSSLILNKIFDVFVG